jgi:hypothetical protein
MVVVQRTVGRRSQTTPLSSRALVLGLAFFLSTSACSGTTDHASPPTTTPSQVAPSTRVPSVTYRVVPASRRTAKTCLATDLGRAPVAMPRPERITVPVLFPDGGRIDPIGAQVHVGLTAAHIWHAHVNTPTASVGLYTSPVATYRLVLGYYTDRPAITDAPGQPMHSEIQHVAAWLILEYHVPIIPEPAFGPGSTTPHAPCIFSDWFMATDATTGADLGSGTT